MRTPKEIVDAGGAVVIDGTATVMGREAYLTSIGYSPDGKPMSVTARFDQGEWWRTRRGEWLRIADMEPGHRYNTAAMLMRNAGLHANRYAWGFSDAVSAHDGGEMAHDALERAEDELWRVVVGSDEGPKVWLRRTALYKALTAGLKVKGDARLSWQANGRDPVTGKKVRLPLAPVCMDSSCGCSGEAHA